MKHNRNILHSCSLSILSFNFDTQLFAPKNIFQVFAPRDIFQVYAPRFGEFEPKKNIFQAHRVGGQFYIFYVSCLTFYTLVYVLYTFFVILMPFYALGLLAPSGQHPATDITILYFLRKLADFVYFAIFFYVNSLAFYSLGPLVHYSPPRPIDIASLTTSKGPRGSSIH